MSVHMNYPTIDAALMRAGHKWADEIGHRVVNRAQAILVDHGHVDEGRLLASIEHSILELTPSGAKVGIGSNLHYANYFHTGTGIHGPKGSPIVPVSAKVLKFKSRGNLKGSLPKERGTWVFARSVKGMEADPFLSDALADVLGTITRRNP